MLLPGAFLDMHFTFLSGATNLYTWNSLLMLLLFFVFNTIGTLLAIRFPQSNRKTIAHAVLRVLYPILTILIV